MSPPPGSVTRSPAPPLPRPPTSPSGRRRQSFRFDRQFLEGLPGQQAL